MERIKFSVQNVQRKSQKRESISIKQKEEKLFNDILINKSLILNRHNNKEQCQTNILVKKEEHKYAML